MKAGIAAIALVLLTACDSPSPAFMHAEKTVVEIDGSRFSVHRRGDRVEVYRVSPEWLPRLSEVLARARRAIEQATGCPVADGSLSGDHALIRAELNCDGSAAPPPRPAAVLTYDCEVVDSWTIDSRATEVQAIECDPREAS